LRLKSLCVMGYLLRGEMRFFIKLKECSFLILILFHRQLHKYNILIIIEMGTTD